jgi:hypothetical protein
MKLLNWFRFRVSPKILLDGQLRNRMGLVQKDINAVRMYAKYRQWQDAYRELLSDHYDFFIKHTGALNWANHYVWEGNIDEILHGEKVIEAYKEWNIDLFAEYPDLEK